MKEGDDTKLDGHDHHPPQQISLLRQILGYAEAKGKYDFSLYGQKVLVIHEKTLHPPEILSYALLLTSRLSWWGFGQPCAYADNSDTSTLIIVSLAPTKHIPTVVTEIWSLTGVLTVTSITHGPGCNGGHGQAGDFRQFTLVVKTFQDWFVTFWSLPHPVNKCLR